MPGNLMVISFDLAGRNIRSGNLIVQQQPGSGAKGTVDDGNALSGQVRHTGNIFRIARPDQNTLLPTAEIDENRRFFQLLIGKIEIIFLIIVLQQMAHPYMADSPPEALQTAHAAEIGKKTYRFGLPRMKERQRLLKEQIVTPCQQQHPMLRGIIVARFAVVDDMGLQPFFHQPSRE
ncbi:MAG: hypothetical protein ACD_75C00811G0001 [uncultured bacterium]|nr:MAG: hypothetical protein ACD_75C00811G0001 [uncultured bacterium]